MEGDTYARLVLDALERLDVGVIVAELAPPRVVHANASALEQFGVSESELKTANPLDFVVPEERPVLIDRLQRRLSGEILPASEITLGRPDGTRSTYRCRIVDHTMEGRPGAVIFFSALQEPRAADIAADARYRALVDAAPDGVTITRDDKFLYANNVALAMTGCARFEELSRRKVSEFLSAQDGRVMDERTAAMVREGTRFPRRDYTVHAKDRATTIEVSSMVIDFEGGPAILAFLRDVTETRRAQGELERAHRLTALGTLVAGVAHEVNNPLSFANLATEVLQRFFDDGGREIDVGQQALGNITTALDRIGALVRELRAFVRSDPPVLVPLPLSEIVASSVRMTAPSIRQRARLEVDVPELPMVLSAPGRLEQVFVNLLINAVQSFDRDDETHNVVRVRGICGNGEATVIVEDNGRGIRPEHRASVFDLFFTTKPAGEGTGLGLSISHAIVAQHGGRIDIASEDGRGTTMTVVLPTAREASPAPDPRTPASSTPQAIRVLIVDDERAICSLLRQLLPSKYEVSMAVGGDEAEAILLGSDAHFDVVLCDLRMPDLSGTALFERVRAQRPELARGFVFMSGGLAEDDVIEHDGQPLPRLEKPFPARDLVAVIERVANARRS